MRRTSKLIVLLSLFSSGLVLADGFGTFGKQDDLKMTVIVDVGEAEKIDAPFGKLGAKDKIKLAGKCFEPFGYIGSWGYSKKAALLLVDQSKSVKIALLDNGIGSINVDVISVTQVDCTDNSVSDLPSDPQKALEVLRKRQEAIQRELERLKSNN